jgi:hypothetical protein
MSLPFLQGCGSAVNFLRSGSSLFAPNKTGFSQLSKNADLNSVHCFFNFMSLFCSFIMSQKRLGSQIRGRVPTHFVLRSRPNLNILVQKDTNLFESGSAWKIPDSAKSPVSNRKNRDSDQVRQSFL